MTLAIISLPRSKAATADMAIVREGEAALWLLHGDYAKAYDLLSAADVFWRDALDCIGNDGDQWSRKR